jgi:hypothetical protein
VGPTGCRGRASVLEKLTRPSDARRNPARRRNEIGVWAHGHNEYQEFTRRPPAPSAGRRRAARQRFHGVAGTQKATVVGIVDEDSTQGQTFV